MEFSGFTDIGKVSSFQLETELKLHLDDYAFNHAKEYLEVRIPLASPNPCPALNEAFLTQTPIDIRLGDTVRTYKCFVIGKAKTGMIGLDFIEYTLMTKGGFNGAIIA